MDQQSLFYMNMQVQPLKRNMKGMRAALQKEQTHIAVFMNSFILKLLHFLTRLLIKEVFDLSAEETSSDGMKIA